MPRLHLLDRMFDLILSAILELQGVRTANSSGDSVSTSLTIGDLQRLLSVFARAEGGNVSGGLTNAPDDDDDDADYVDEEEEEDTAPGYYTYGWGGPTRSTWNREEWWPEVTEPKKEGLELLYSGEFGRISHQKASRDGRNNVARNLLSRGLSSRPVYKEDITSVRAMSRSLPLHADSTAGYTS